MQLRVWITMATCMTGRGVWLARSNGREVEDGRLPKVGWGKMIIGLGVVFWLSERGVRNEGQGGNNGINGIVFGAVCLPILGGEFRSVSFV